MKEMPTWDDIIDNPLKAAVPTKLMDQIFTHHMLVKRTTQASWPAVMAYVMREDYPPLLNVLFVFESTKLNMYLCETKEFKQWSNSNTAFM